MEASPHRVGTEGLVVLVRPGEVLKQVPEALWADDAKVDAHPVVGHAAHARRARGMHLADQRELGERRGESCRIRRARHQVEVLARVGPAAGAAGDLHPLGRRVLTHRLGEGLGDGPGAREEQARLGPVVETRVQRDQHALLGLRSEARDLAETLALGRRAEVVERGDPELVEQLAGALGAESGQARDLHEPRGVLGLQLLGRGYLARLEQDLELLGDRLPDARELCHAAVPGQVLDRRVGLADGLGRVAVGDHAVGDGAVEFVEVRQLVEMESYFGVPHRAL